MTIQWRLMDVFKEVEIYHFFLEIFLVMWVLWLIFRKSNQTDQLNLTEAEKQQLIMDWEPEPLVEQVSLHHPALKFKVVNGKVGKYVNIDGISCLNFASHNYLGFVENQSIEESAIKSLHKYGVGSCGPRGFYGTVDVHLDLEERLANFMEMEEAVVYSYSFSTIASAIPAYSKKGDIIFVDERVNFAIQKGLDASRSRIYFFKHNDVNDLEKLLEQQAQLDKKNPKKAAKTRRFLIVEGVYMNTGTICCLPELIELRKRYKLRIFIDESISFGSIGRTGRGVTEYFNIHRNEVDLIVGSMENSIASIGGFCVGSSFIVEHQRLSGLGYCFSASLPPLLASAAITALDIIEQNPKLLETLVQCCHQLHNALKESEVINTYFDIPSHADSPVQHLVLKDNTNPYLHQINILNNIVDLCIQNEVALITSAYLEEVEKFQPPPSLRITTNVQLDIDDIKHLINTLQNTCVSVFTT